jgi:uncharacterized RDD family membrane protein YckC
LIDSGTALVIAMLAWPFPIARAYLPVPIIIVSVLVFWQLIQVLYHVITVGFWGATGGMRLLGMSLEGRGGERASSSAARSWALWQGLTCVLVAVAPRAMATGVLSPERRSGTVLVHRG